MLSTSANGSAASYRSPAPVAAPALTGSRLEKKLFQTPARPPTHTVAPAGPAAVTWHGAQSEPRPDGKHGGRAGAALPHGIAQRGRAIARVGDQQPRPALPDRVSQILGLPVVALPGSRPAGEGRRLQQACVGEPREVEAALRTLLAAADAGCARPQAPLPEGFLDALDQAYEAQFPHRQSWPHRIETLAHWVGVATGMATFIADAVPPPPAHAPPPDTPLERVQRLLRPLGPLPPALGPVHAAQPQTWDELLGQAPAQGEGRGLCSTPAIRRWAQGQPERIQALHLLFAHAEAQVRAGRQPAGTLDGLHEAYQRGTTADENLLQPERTVATLACALGSGISPAQLRGSITRSRYGAELLRALVTPLMIYMPLGWGGNSLLAAKWAEERAVFSPAEKFWTTFLLATLIGLGEFMNASARQAGAGPMYSRNVTSQDIPGQGRQVVPANDFMSAVRATAFVWFLPGLALVHRFVRDDDPALSAQQQAAVRAEQQADARFWVGLLCTLGVAMHNYLVPIAARLNTLPALDGRNADEFRSHVHYMNQPAWHGLPTYLGNLVKGVGRALWSPAPDATTWGRKVWTALPESTTALRFMLRTGFSHLLLNLAPVLTEAFKKHDYSDEEASYRAGLVAFAAISIGWGPAMELTHQLCQRIGSSAAREQALAANLRQAHAVRMRAAVPTAVMPPPAQDNPPLEP